MLVDIFGNSLSFSCGECGIDVKGVEIEENKSVENRGFSSVEEFVGKLARRFWRLEALFLLSVEIYPLPNNG